MSNTSQVKHLVTRYEAQENFRNAAAILALETASHHARADALAEIVKQVAPFCKEGTTIGEYTLYQTLNEQPNRYWLLGLNAEEIARDWNVGNI